MKNITRIYAPSMHEALQRLGRELGDDAVILESRELPGGVEVVAALDPDGAVAPVRRPAPERGEGGRRALPEGRSPEDGARVRASRGDPATRRAGVPPTRGASPGDAGPARPGARAGTPANGARRGIGGPAHRDGARAEGSGTDAPAPARRTTHDLLTWLRGFPWAPRTGAPRSGSTVFLGPSGAGKTSLVAKLAAAHVLRHGPDRGVVLNGDAFRFGGQSQLNMLAEMLGIRCLQVHRPEDAARMARDAGRGSLVLIDTPGLRARPGDPSLAWIEAVLGELDAERCLVLPAQSQRAVVDAVLDATASFHVDFLTLTKLDEPGDPVETLRALRPRGVPLGWLSAGDLIPDDLEPATAEGLLELLRTGAGAGTEAREGSGDGNARPRGLFHERA